MRRRDRCCWLIVTCLAGLGVAPTGGLWPDALAQAPASSAGSAGCSVMAPPVVLNPSAPAPEDKPLPINLPTALRLANVRPIDISLASERIRVAAAQLERAQALWLPTLYLGADYFRYDGQLPTTEGDTEPVSKSDLMVGGGPWLHFALSDALFAPLAARQVVRARQAGFQAVSNDSLLAAAEAYFNVQEARGQLAGAEDATHRAQDLLSRVEQLGKKLAAPVEVVRAREELQERLDDRERARERWRLASVDLVRILRLDPSSLIQPVEPPHLQITLVGLNQPVDDLIPIALTNRPELAAQQALVQATLAQLRQERLRPLIPSLVLTPASSIPASTLAAGVLGGGRNDFLGNFRGRSDFDVQVLWELQNLGLGNRALVKEREAENRQALLELFRIQDLVAAEVAQAYAQAQSAAARVGQTEKGLKNAVESAERNLKGMTQIIGPENLLLLAIRPQEVVAAVRALVRSYNHYYTAVADYNRAQFRLYRAMGRPAQAVANGSLARPVAPAASGSPNCRPGHATLGFVD